ncbi:Glycosyl transferase family 2 [Roseivivax lentus]|uniref:Glycosyl transferase family 2 n=1 Tax=Roseivivax lentus TaxID=633194 RepID=A0A1N7LA29_9RHOB|nr:glycosyltransferase family 2 protein [Roseivivax lentus]SIS70712.1 Glycosyl transferase family 2 [Roseivivax lentus]
MAARTSKSPSYPGGIDAVLTQMEGRREPLSHAEGEGLPPLDIDLKALKKAIVPNPADDPAEQPPFRSSYHRKRFALRQEFTGKSELACLHGLLVAHLRKRAWPDHAPALFRRLWAEEADFLLAALDARWQVSAVTTFGDHGAGAEERAVGLALSTLFGAMKLYETERLFSGRPPEAAFALDDKVKAPLPMQMDAYALGSGGLDVNMLGRLWQEADAAPVIRPLARNLIEALIEDPATIFRRLQVMKARKARRKDADAPKKSRKKNVAPVPARAARPSATAPRWGIVATVRADSADILRFAAHHLELGAHELHLYLDAPNPEAIRALGDDPRLRITTCDDSYWRAAGKERMSAHQLRQVFNATRTMRRQAESLDWIAHIDVDEFLLPDRPLAALLAEVPPDKALAHLTPVEALATEPGTTPAAFKMTHTAAGIRKASIQDVYPTFGMHLTGGFLSHATGKVFARTGIPDARLGIHTLKYRGADVSNRAPLAGCLLAHLHAPSWEAFLHHLPFRRSVGSYAKQSERPGKLGVADILTYLEAEEGEAGLRTFFDEVCRDTPELRQKLAAHGMLVEWPLDLDGAVARVFRGRAA